MFRYPTGICLILISLFFSISYSSFHSGPLDAQVATYPFTVEVKGPASQILHKQSLEYRNRAALEPQNHADRSEGPLSLPPSNIEAIEKNHASIFSVALYTFLMAAATGLGALPFFFVRELNPRWLGLSNALASGVMLAASFGLLQEGLELAAAARGPWVLLRLLAGVLAGLVFIIWSQNFLEDKEVSMGHLKGLNARKALMVVGIMTMHSFAEGLGVGVSFGGDKGREQGAFITWAMALHNIPEGLAVALVAVPRGEGKWTAAAWAVFSSMPQPLVAVPAYLCVEVCAWLLPAGLGCAAGTMVWMVFAELIPDALRAADSKAVATTATLAVAGMLTLQSALHALLT